MNSRWGLDDFVPRGGVGLLLQSCLGGLAGYLLGVGVVWCARFQAVRVLSLRGSDDFVGLLPRFSIALRV